MTANAPASAMDELIRKSREHYEACLDCCWSEDGEEARAELAALREENARIREALGDLIEAIEHDARANDKVLANEVWTEIDAARSALAARGQGGK